MERKFPASVIARNVASAVIVALGSLAVLGLSPSAAWAQLTEPFLPVPPIPITPNVPPAQPVPLDRSLTIVDRPRPELDALGIRVGSFFFFPRFEVDEVYNDNIFATSSGNTGDFITLLAPSFDVRSNFSRNALNLGAGLGQSLYASNPNQDTTDAFVNATGRLDVDGAHDFHGGLRVEKLHEDIGSSPNVPGDAIEPIKYTQYTATAGFQQTKLRINYSADLSARRQEFDAVPGAGGGLLAQDANNNFAYEATLRGAYEFVPNYQGFVRGSYNIRRYDHGIGGGIPTLDSDGYRIDIGARVDLTGLIYGEAYIGYLEQDYRAGFFGTISGLDAGGRLVWNVTQLTSLTFKASRTVQDVNTTALAVAGIGLTNSPGYLETTIGASVDHELLRNLLLNGNVSLINDDFAGIQRTDNYLQAGIGAKYLLNRNLYIGPTYSFQHRESDGTSAINAFTRNIFLLRVSTQL
jgi:hypothetical protein